MSRWLRAGDPALASSEDREVAAALVAAVPAGDDRVDADLLVIAELVASKADVAVRTCRPGHLTGSAMVLDAAGERAVLLLHTKLGRWLQPGGHADGDTNLVGVAWREATEETGIEGLAVWADPIDLDIHLVRPPAEDAHLHLDVRFLLVAPEGAELVGNEESRALEWVPVGEVADRGVDPGLLRLLASARTRYHDLR